MKKSIWIFLLAVLLPGFVLGWLALRSAEEQQIIFERRTAELYQKETEALAATAREAVEAERRAFGDMVHRLLARSDAQALARDFTNSLMDAWPRKAVGFVLGPEGQMLSPSTSMAAKNPDWREFLWNNGSFLCSTQPAVVYPVPVETGKSLAYGQALKARSSLASNDGKPALTVGRDGDQTVLAQKGAGAEQQQQEIFLKAPIQSDAKGSAQTRARGSNENFGSHVQGGTRSPAQTPRGSVTHESDSADARTDAAQDTSSEKKMARDEVNAGAEAKTDLSKAVQAPREAETNKDDLQTQPPQRTPSLARSPAALLERPSFPAPAPAPPTPQLATGTEVQTAATQTRAAAARPQARAPQAVTSPPPILQSVPAPTGSATGADETRGLAMGTARPQGSPAPAAHAPTAVPPAPATEERLKLKLPIGRSPEGAQTDPASPADLQLEMLPQQIRPLAEEKARSLEDLSANVGTATSDSPAAERKRILQPTNPTAPADRLALQSSSQLSGSDSRADADPRQGIQSSSYYRANSDVFNRMVEPQRQGNSAASNWSAILPATADFRALTNHSDEGMLARFVQDKLDLIFWIRPPEAPEMVFGCLIEAGDLAPLWKDLFANRVEESRAERPAFVLALLNDKAKPVATFPALDKAREWKRPFVASEIGEVLPHWEAALYLATPTAIADTARGLRRTLGFTIAGAIALIAIGGWLVVADVRRQLALAQQKTDFVSNVSHELKTPLTSIRMFAELMHDRPPPPEKQGQYLRIITVEAERLTRLINNVLDFAKLERRQKRFDKRSLDLCEVITRVWEGQEMHLRDAGFQTKWEAAAGPYPVSGDEDALAQILVNLLSNAEKYSRERKEVELVTWVEKGCIHVSVLDRGMGVPDGEDRKIFEAFYRAHDSLSSGIQGSGLGLTLAQRLAREHGGEIVFERRKDGGSRFTLRLPLVNGHELASSGTDTSPNQEPTA